MDSVTRAANGSPSGGAYDSKTWRVSFKKHSYPITWADSSSRRDRRKVEFGYRSSVSDLRVKSGESSVGGVAKTREAGNLHPAFRTWR